MLSHGFLFTQIFSLLLVLVWLGLVFYALLALRRRTLNATAKALWALIILAIPRCWGQWPFSSFNRRTCEPIVIPT